MNGGRAPERGEVVYLAVEIAAGERIHEIGDRALVLELTADGIAIEVGGDEVRCRVGDVVARRPRESRAPTWPRRTTGPAQPALG